MLPGGGVDQGSLADLLEWFLTFDQRVSLMRHPHVEELFRWKQSDDNLKGIQPYPFENAEARFAIGVSQAISANGTREALRGWITNVLGALGEAKQTNEDLAKSFGLKQDASHISEAEKIPSEQERRVYLGACWIESLCTAEVRFLGWVYREIYGEPFEPLAPS